MLVFIVLPLLTAKGRLLLQIFYRTLNRLFYNVVVKMPSTRTGVTYPHKRSLAASPFPAYFFRYPILRQDYFSGFFVVDESALYISKFVLFIFSKYRQYPAQLLYTPASQKCQASSMHRMALRLFDGIRSFPRHRFQNGLIMTWNASRSSTRFKGLSLK